MAIAVVLCSCRESTASKAEDACDCLERHASAMLTPSDVAALEDAASMCFSDDPAQLEREAEACLPWVAGTDARNGLAVDVEYWCSDVCPDAGVLLVAYVGVDEPDCCSAGGRPGYDYAWGGYVGCFPPETSYGDLGECG